MIYGDEEDWSDVPPCETGWYWASRALGQVMPVEICLGELRKINDFSFEAPLMWRAATSPALHQLDTLIKWWGPRIGRTPPLPEHIRVVVALNRENKLNGELAALDMKTDGARIAAAHVGQATRHPDPIWAEQEKTERRSEFIRRLTSGE